jgi:hypothetical protein
VVLIVAASAEPVVLLVLVTLWLPLAWWAARRYWRGLVPYNPRNPFSRKVQTSMAQLAPLAALTFTLLDFALLIYVVWGIHARGAKVAFAIAAIGGLCVAVLGIALIYTGHPRWAIPHRLRDGLPSPTDGAGDPVRDT